MPTSDEMLELPVVRSAWLMKAEFLSETMWAWDGRGNLTVGGQVYQGMGEVISIDGVESIPGTSAHPLTITMSGIDPTLIGYAQDMDEYKNRPFTLWQCLFDDELQPVEPLLFRGDGLMDLLSISMPDQSQRTITMTVESIWADRGQAAHATYSEADQRSRFPGDRGMDFQPEVAIGAEAIWPFIKGK